MASYGSDPSKLIAAVESIQQHSTTDWRLFLIHNPSPGDEPVKHAIGKLAAEDKRLIVDWEDVNIGYAGAVAMLMQAGVTEYLAWLDNDARILTPGWDETLCSFLDRFHEIGLIFPNGGAYPIPRGPYTEVMWGVGFCWVLNRLAMSDAGQFDTALRHQEEPDYALRIRMQGWKCAAVPEVGVDHCATATNDPASIERINRGVVNFVNKWVRYFCGKQFSYHSPNVLRWEDWPPNALYLEEYNRPKLPGLNDSPEVVSLDGREYDLIRVPRFKDFYRGRII